MVEVYEARLCCTSWKLRRGPAFCTVWAVRVRRFFSDLATGAAAGYVGLGVMDLVTSRLYSLAPVTDKEREKSVSPGVAYTVAARKSAALLGVSLKDAEATVVGSIYHYLMGLGWAPVYVLLRRVIRMSAPPAGLITGLGLWAGFDEGLVPALGFSAPSRAYPASTHLRGFLGHLAYGLTVMTVVEAIGLAE
jgi:uncharacterized membrane protein YagU involved in acid resistance